uniref:Uncharacterized protein n=1 Tax=Arundo donax TaxID=35708 RepID=A0A0A8YHS0_ARUDO
MVRVWDPWSPPRAPGATVALRPSAASLLLLPPMPLPLLSLLGRGMAMVWTTMAILAWSSSTQVTSPFSFFPRHSALCDG